MSKESFAGKTPRPLMYRAWDRVAKKMSPNFTLFGEFTLLGAVHAWQDEIGVKKEYGSLGRLNDLEIMQFTGIYDKNGIPVYDGDILADPILPKVVEWKTHAIVQYGHGDSTTCLFAGFDFWSWGNAREEVEKRLEVIGNIYENPELV